MHRSSCGPAWRTAIMLATLVALYAFAPAANAQSITDYTEYTYAVPAGGIGSSADYTVTRTFQAPIVSLRLYIVSGQADDIGFVGSTLVTNIRGQCEGVGAVPSTQEVTDQVTISGNTATFLLRAVENCCCVTGWGSATQGDRANARFLWVVTLSGSDCAVPPLTPITDPLALSFEQGHTLDIADMTSLMQAALGCLQQAAAAIGGSITVNSAYRPPAYQQHLLEVWNDWQDLRNSRDPNCAARRAALQQEFQRHRMVHRPAVNSDHSRGRAFDANWNLPAGVSIDALAADCGLQRIVSNDPVHFTHR